MAKYPENTAERLLGLLGEILREGDANILPPEKARLDRMNPATRNALEALSNTGFLEVPPTRDRYRVSSPGLFMLHKHGDTKAGQIVDGISRLIGPMGSFAEIYKQPKGHEADLTLAQLAALLSCSQQEAEVCARFLSDLGVLGGSTPAAYFGGMISVRIGERCFDGSRFDDFLPLDGMLNEKWPQATSWALDSDAWRRRLFDGVNDGETTKSTSKVRLIAKEKGGAYGAIWRGEDDLSRTVAVKFIAPSMAGVSSPMDHARALARSHHANVVHVFFLERLENPDTGQVSDAIVMEWLDGVTWFERCGRAMNEGEALRLGLGLLDAIEFMHSRDIVHADLHRENVMVVNGATKVIDPLYRAADTLALLDTSSKDERKAKDARYVFDRLTELLETTGIDTATFRQNAAGKSLVDQRSSFTQILRTQPAVTPQATARADRNNLLTIMAEAQSESSSLPDVLLRAALLAERLGDADLRSFCESELSGNFDGHPEHRVTEMFVGVNEINPAFGGWSGGWPVVRTHLEESDGFSKVRFFEGRPIGLLEEESRRPRSAKVFARARSLKLGDFSVEADNPEQEVFCYESPDAVGSIVSRVRKRLTTMIATHLK